MEGTLTTGSQRAMFHYRVWNHHLVSDFDLGELESGDGQGVGDLISILRSTQEHWPRREDQPRVEDRFDNGDIWFASWKAGDGYVIQFPDLCSFLVRPSVKHIECDPVPGVADSTIAHLVLDHALPRLLSLTAGFVVFHASAVQIRDRVVTILGKSGQGKSTLATWFASQGFPLLTDDCLVVRWDEAAAQWMAQPSYHSVRLWPDSVDALGIEQSNLREFAGYSSKRRTGREVNFRFASGGAPLAACFALSDPVEAGLGSAHSGPPELRPLSVNEAFMALAGAVFRIDPGDPEINRREFEVLTSLTGTVRFWSLHYEREYRWLLEVQEAMIQAIHADDLPDPTSQSRDVGHPDPSDERKLP